MARRVDKSTSGGERALPSLTVENYIKAIFQICLTGEGQAATGQLAHALGVSPGTVTSMLKTLSEGNLVTYTPYEGVRLTRYRHRAGTRESCGGIA